jgi:class 3 adenylate cyclase
MSRWDEAAQHFEDAIEMNLKMGARPFLARCQQEYAGMLLARDKAGDPSTSLRAGREKGLQLLNQALEIAQELGMKVVVERALKLKLEAQGISLSDLGSSIDTVAREVLADQPDLKPHAAPDGTVTIMFSDIEGSTAMTERLGDQRWMEVLREHNAIVREQVKAHGGFEVKSEGDGFMVAFGSARRALESAIAIQRAFAGERGVGARRRDDGTERQDVADDDRVIDSATGSEASPLQRSETEIRVRIGLHTGEAIKEGEDFFGKNVILAARIAAQARGGEVLVSSLLKALVDSAGDIAFGETRAVELKGLFGTHEIHEVKWM